MEKTCNVCGGTFPLHMFSPKKDTKDKLANLCKPCDSASSREYQRLNAEKRQIYERERQKTQQRKETNNARRRAQTERAQARNKLHWQLQKGNIAKEACAVCGELKVQAHHEDYNKPLEVVWLCQTHHYEAHRKYN